LIPTCTVIVNPLVTVRLQHISERRRQFDGIVRPPGRPGDVPGDEADAPLGHERRVHGERPVGLDEEHVDVRTVVEDRPEVVAAVEPRRLGRLRVQVADLHDLRARARHRVADPGHAQHGQEARVERAGREHDLVGLGDRRERVRVRGRVVRHELDAPDPPRDVHDCDLPLDRFAVDVGLQHDRLGGRGPHPPDRAEQGRRRVDGRDGVAERLVEAGEDEVAEGVPLELTGAEAVLEGGGPELVVGERHEAAAQVARREHVEVAAQPTRRPAVVGDAHDGEHLVGVAAGGAQHARQAVPAAERDDPWLTHGRGPGGARSRGSRARPAAARARRR
jgi:hypothetical protein